MRRSQTATFVEPTWGPPGSCRPHIGPMNLAIRVIHSGYMRIESTDAVAGRHIPMLSPPFDASRNHCLLFDYKVWMAEYSRTYAPSPRLEVYLSPSSHVYSGSLVWGSNGTEEGQAQLSLWARSGAVSHRLAIVGVIGDPATTLINIANVQLNDGNCEDTNCGETLCSDGYKDYSISTDGMFLLTLNEITK